MIPYIREETVQKLVNERKAFGLAEEVFRQIAEKKAWMPPKIYLNVPGNGDFRAMPALVRSGRGEDACGIKWVSVFPDNLRRGLPTVNGTILLNSAATGRLLVVMEANGITALRTAAAAAVATHYLANPRPKVLAVVGAGLQGEYQLRALCDRYDFKEIRVWGFQAGEARKFCRRLSGEFQNLRPCAAIPPCVREADVIVTCTPSRRPLVKKTWVKPGAHINAIGADAKGKEELEPALVGAARVVVDEWEQASHSGEINVPVSRGFFTKADLHAELADIVSGRKEGRRDAREITVFDSTGLAVLDIRFADAVYRAWAKKRARNPS